MFGNPIHDLMCALALPLHAFVRYLEKVVCYVSRAFCVHIWFLSMYLINWYIYVFDSPFYPLIVYNFDQRLNSKVPWEYTDNKLDFNMKINKVY